MVEHCSRREGAARKSGQIRHKREGLLPGRDQFNVSVRQPRRAETLRSASAPFRRFVGFTKLLSGKPARVPRNL